MQSKGARALVALGSIALIVVLFVVLSGDDDSGEDAAQATATTTADPAEADAPGGGGDGSEPEEPEKPDEPEFERIVVADGEPRGGVRDLEYRKGDRVRLEVVSDVDEHVHVHGYDLFEDVAAGGKAKFSFVADIDGVFEIELEDSGVPLAELVVKP